ncbi:Uma2 family endonuclease [Micromonospora lupini]|uniref:Uma2 family endonuclease n=1 Tax=Micromonospora lupini TaxID=285679 RepID=UPI00340BB260
MLSSQTEVSATAQHEVIEAHPMSVAHEPVPRHPRDVPAKSFEMLACRSDAWTADAALGLLPENSGPRVEVLRGCVVITPASDLDRRTVQRELGYLLKQAARRVGLWLYHEVNVLSDDDLFIPAITVLKVPGGGRTAMSIRHAVLLGEIVSAGERRANVIDRPREYAAVGVPFFLRVDLRNRVPAIALFELVEGEYRPLAAAAAGSTFAMREPFEFAIDPAELLDEEGPRDAAATDLAGGTS